ncbi:MAG: glycosyltransferase family 92 protein [Endomicrobium sp.]|jgi:hypothetical protein|nr:glycosyltransferase family 92 protein [Endomicrobium sp.]
MKFTLAKVLVRTLKIIVSVFSSFIFYSPLRRKIRKSVLSLRTKINITALEHNRTYPNYLSILACVKNEALYLKEWIEYHKLLGVEKFYICDNDSDDNIMEVLKPYIESGEVAYKKFHGKGIQRKMYTDSVQRCKKFTRWLAIIDIDEFIVPLKHDNIKDFLKEYEDFSQVTIHYRFFGTCGHKNKPEGLVIENYMYSKDTNPTGKSIVNPRAIIGKTNIHYSTVIGLPGDERKLPYLEDPAIDIATTDIISINHYYTKSEEEFITVKDARGNLNHHGGVYLREELKEYDITCPEMLYNDSIKRFIPKLKEVMNKKV